MARDRRQPEAARGLPEFDFDDEQAQQTAPQSAQSARTPEVSSTTDMTAGIVFTPDAWERFSKTAVKNVRHMDDRERAINEAFIGLYGSRPGDRRRAISAGPAASRTIAAAPQSVAAAARPGARQGTEGAKQGARRTVADPESSTPPTSENPNEPSTKSLGEWVRKHRKLTIGAAAVAAVASVAFMSLEGKGNGEATAASLTAAEQLPKDLHTDTLTCGTPFAIVTPATGQNLEARIPVQLKNQPAENAYVSLNIKQFSPPAMALAACGIQDPATKGSAVWARLNKDKNQYSISRAAISLSATPWVQTLQHTSKGDIAENQVLTNIANVILPTPGTGLSLHVGDKVISDSEKSKYPIAQQPSVIMKDMSNPKSPRLFYDPLFVKELITKMQIDTLKALEDPNQCSKVEPALDAASAANLAQLNDIKKTIAITIDHKTEYGKASTDFLKRADVKLAVTPNAVTVNNFDLSCPTEPVLPKDNAAKPPATAPAKTTAPAKK